MKDITEFKNAVKECKSGNHILNAMDNGFTIDEGEFIVILEPSKTGKSTLLNMLEGQDSVTSSWIMVNNQNIESFNDIMPREFTVENVSFIFQFYNVIPNLTALENVELRKDIVDGGIERITVNEIPKGVVDLEW